MAFKILKIICANVAILLALLILPALSFEVYIFVKSKLAENGAKDPVALYPTYEDRERAAKLLREFSILTTNYKSFVGWQRKKVDYEFTNISGMYNTRKSTGQVIDNSIWFFGGSTMWVTGATDSGTIPSQFNDLTSQPVFNFGETGWNSRQSLNSVNKCNRRWV